MKKFMYLAGAALALSMSFTSCGKDPKPINDIVENGYYVIGEATGITELTQTGAAALQMAVGHNEAQENALREGMYEKYVILEGGKEFQIVLKAGNAYSYYGANLEEAALPTDGVELEGYKGAIAENLKMKVNETGLYHIVMDFNQDGLLDEAGKQQIVIAKAEQWGVRGGMNSWGYTEGVKGNGYTWTWTDQELAAGGDFKFAYGQLWKINLDIAEQVKANANLGLDCVPGAGNIVVEDAGKYTITLTFDQKGGDIKDSWSYTVTLTQKSDLPTTLYMIGNDFGSWDWASDGVVDMIPVHSHAGQFWAVKYLTTESQFKWSPNKAWNGDFAKMDTNEGFNNDNEGGNAQVEADGLYTIFIDLRESVIKIYPAKIYGMGLCFGTDDDAWKEGTYPFAVEDKKAVATTTGEGELRIYAEMPDNAGNWWQSEFVILNGAIVYRGDGDDQERVNVAAGKKVSLDFNANTGTIE